MTGKNNQDLEPRVRRRERNRGVRMTVTHHNARSRKYRREDRVEPQEDSRIGGLGEDHLRLLVCPVRLPRQERQALQILRQQDGLERATQTRSAGGVEELQDRRFMS